MQPKNYTKMKTLNNPLLISPDIERMWRTATGRRGEKYNRLGERMRREEIPPTGFGRFR